MDTSSSFDGPGVRRRRRQAGTRTSNGHDRHGHGRQRRHQRRDEEDASYIRSSWKALGLALMGMTVWYLTPVSEYAIQALLAFVPPEADIALGEHALRESRGKPEELLGRPIYYDAYWTPQLEDIGSELVSYLEKDPQYAVAKDFRWDFAILNEREIVNAFALPGGTVRVTRGLLEQLDHLSHAEVAALLGHEVGHVIHRHSQARMLERKLLTTILQALIYEDEDPEEESFGEAIGELLLQSADWLGQQSFSRANEYQADATSWDLLKASHRYHPQAMQSLLSKLWDYHGRSNGETSWESTHPGTLDRIQALDDKWKALPANERRRITRATSN